MFLQKLPIAAVTTAATSVRLPQAPAITLPLPAPAPAPAVRHSRQRADHARYQAKCRAAMLF